MKKGLATTAVTFDRKIATVDDELDLLAVIHRLPGVEKVWIEGNALHVVYEASQTTREDVARAIERCGYPIPA